MKNNYLKVQEAIQTMLCTLSTKDAKRVVKYLSTSWVGEGIDLEQPKPTFASLTFASLRAVNVARCESGTGFNHPLDAWMVDQWTNAMQGEAGEAGNFAKKLSRIRHLDNARVNKKDERDEQKLVRKMLRELAGCVIYADLVAASEGFDLEQFVCLEFNAKSKEIGYKGTGL